MTKSRNIRKTLKPSKEDLYAMIASGLTPYQIADQLGYSEGGWSNIYKYCRDYGIEVNFKPHYEMRSIPFSKEQKDIMYGSLIGDAYLRPSGNSYSLSFTHGEKQYEYLKWKLDKFKNFVSQKNLYKYENDFHGNKPTYSFGTINHPDLTEAFNITHPHGKKFVTKEWLSLLSPLSLAVWYMDDGSLNKSTHVIVISTNEYCEEEQANMIEFFKDNYDLNLKREKRRNDQYVLRINASESRKFRDIVKDYIPNCMSYKL